MIDRIIFYGYLSDSFEGILRPFFALKPKILGHLFHFPSFRGIGKEFRAISIEI